MIDAQRDLPEAQGSVRSPSPQEKVVWRSGHFQFPLDTAKRAYEVVASVSWDDRCGNNSNAFHCNFRVLTADMQRESEFYSFSEVPDHIISSIPAEIQALTRWNGCHPFGPWYYIENTVFLAGDRDPNGLRAGDRVQRKTLGGAEMWELVAVSRIGETTPLYKLKTTATGGKPVDEYRLEWRPLYREGEGKARELDSARKVAIWPDATDEQLCSPTLALDLMQRLPKLLVEFRKTVESLGFVW